MTETEYKLLVDLYADSLYRFILRLCGNTQSASDLVQDTFIKLWEYVNNENREKIRNQKSFLFSIAYRQFVDIYRQKQKFENFVHFETEKTDRAEEKSGEISEETREVIYRAIENLPYSQRTVFVLRDLETYSYAEIASITDLSEAQIKTYLFRARLFLRKYIGKIENLV